MQEARSRLAGMLVHPFTRRCVIGQYTPIQQGGDPGEETWLHRPMTPLSVALSVRLVAALEGRQIRPKAELGFHDEGGSVAALIGERILAPP